MIVRLYYGATERKQMSYALGQFFVIFLGTCFDLNPEIKVRNVSFFVRWQKSMIFAVETVHSDIYLPKC